MAARSFCRSIRKVSATTVPVAGPMVLPYMVTCGRIWLRMGACGCPWQHVAAYGCTGPCTACVWQRSVASNFCRSWSKVSAKTVPATGPTVWPYVATCGQTWLHMAALDSMWARMGTQGCIRHAHGHIWLHAAPAAADGKSVQQLCLQWGRRFGLYGRMSLNIVAHGRI